MTKSLILFAALSLLSATDGGGTGSLPDSELRSRIVGPWIVPSDSSDHSITNQYSVETYFADGSVTLTLYEDRRCQNVRLSIRAKWELRKGILTTTVNKTTVLHDEVVRIADGVMTLHAIGSANSYKRERGTICEVAKS